MLYVNPHIDLDDFDDDDLKKELESRGYSVAKHGVSTDDMPDLEHVEHLAICGQLDAARAEALQQVGKAIGRRLQ